MQLGLDVHRGLLHTESAEEVRAAAKSATDSRTECSAYGGTNAFDAGAYSRADSGGVFRRFARVRRERGRDLLRRCGRLGLRVRGGVRVHRGVLRQPRAAHVRAHDAGADAGVDAGAGADVTPVAIPNAGASGARLRRERTRLRHLSRWDL